MIEATIIIGKFKDEDFLISRIPLIQIDLLFEFKRAQFLVRLIFTITINKLRGQLLEVCEINLELQYFSHGQLACSRVSKPSALFVFSWRKDKKYRSLLNVVIHVLKTPINDYQKNKFRCIYRQTTFIK